jgi:hypothetical protein
MRKKQKHFSQSLFGLFGLFLIGIAFGGCEKDLYDEHIHLAKIKSQISLEEFKRETGLTDFKTSIKIKCWYF